MRPTLLVASFSLLAGCGSSDGPAPRLFDDFTAQDGAAVVFAPVVCTLPIGTVSGAAVAVVFTNYPDACGVVTQTRLCGTRADSRTVLALATQGELGSGGIAGVTPGTFVYMPNPPTGPFRAADAEAAEVDASCTAAPGGAPDMSSGSITISSLTTERVAGSVALRFDNGQALDETFDVAICPVSIDLCDQMTRGCFGRYVCAPAP